MSTKVEFYAVTFVSKNNNNEYISFNPKTLFDKLDEAYSIKENRETFFREIGDKKILMSRLLNDNGYYTVITFGKLKKDASFSFKDDKFEKLEDDIFDVTNLVYNSYDRVAMITKSKSGVNKPTLEDYLNSFLPTNSEYKISLIPIITNKGVEEVRNSNRIKEIKLNLNLNKNMEDFYLDNSIPARGFANIIKSLAHNSKYDIGSEKLGLVLSVENSRGVTCLESEKILNIIDNLNMSTDFISEVEVKYIDNQVNKIDIAKLKNSNIILYYNFQIKDKELGSEYLLHNADKVFTDIRNKYYSRKESIFSSQQSVDFTIEELNLNYRKEDFYS